ncbi:MAG: hypothetical protein GC191_12145 [Azospirillum sp.]|nr:hypothetical protein [Azospirillum sp.]
MAVRIGGRIEADVTPFVAALGQAEQSLGAFEAAAEEVAGGVNRSFDQAGSGATSAIAEFQGLSTALQATANLPPIDLGPLRQALAETAAALDQAGAAAEASAGLVTGAFAGAGQVITSAIVPAVTAAETTVEAFPTPFERIAAGAQAMAATVGTGFGAVGRAVEEAIGVLGGLSPAADEDAQALEDLGDTPVEFGPLRSGLDEATRSVREFADGTVAAMDKSSAAADDAGTAVGRSVAAYDALPATARIAADALGALTAAQRDQTAASQAMVDQSGLVQQSFEQTTASAEAAYQKTLQFWGMLEENARRQGALLNSPDPAETATEAQRRAWSLNVDTGETVQQNPYARYGNGLNYLWGGLDESLSGLRYKVADVLGQIGVDFDKGFATARDAAGAAVSAIGETLGQLPELAGLAAEGVRAIGDQAGGLDRVGAAAERASAGVEQLQASSEAASDRVVRIAEAAGSSGRALATLGNEVPSDTFSAFDDIGRQLEGGLQDLAGETDHISHSLAEFGAAGAAAGGAVHTLVQGLISSGPVGLAAAAGIGALTVALYGAFEGALKAEQEHAELERAIRAAGAQSALTVKDLQDYATSLSRTTLATRDEVLSAGTALAKVHSVVGDAFRRTLELGTDLSAALGGELRGNVERLGRALEDPAKGLDDLVKAGIRFTEAEKETIRTLSDSGQAFAAQQAILNAVARDIGGSGAAEREGLVGRTRDLKEAWGDFVAAVTGSDSTLGQAAAGILTTMSNLIRHINAELDQGIDAQISRLEQERDVLAAQLQSGDFGIRSVFSKEFWSSSTDVAAARQRLEEINTALSALQDRHRRDEVAADVAAEDASGRAVAQQRQVLNDRLTAMQAETEGKLTALSSDRIQKIDQQEEVQLRRLEGLRQELLERGGDPTAVNAQVDEAISLVRQLSLAERAAAEPKQQLVEETKGQVDANQRLIESLSAEIELLHLSERDRAVETALRRLSADATEYQRRQVAELAGALYDEKAALQQQQRETQTLDRLRRQLAEASGVLSGADKAASDAVRELGETASTTAKATADGLAREIYYRQQGRAETTKQKDAAEAYADEIARLNDLLEHGAITQETYGRAADEAWRRMLASSKEWEDGVTRGWLRYRDAAFDSASQAERFLTTSLKASEDAFVSFVTGAKFSFEDLTNSIIEDLLRIFWQRTVIAPIGDALFGSSSGSGGGLFGSIGSWLGGLFEQGGAFGADGSEILYHASGDVLDRPAWWLGADNRINVGGEAGDEGILPLKRNAQGQLGVIATGAAGLGIGPGIGNIAASDNRTTFLVNVDARGSTDPEGTAALVDAAVARALSRIVPGIIRASSDQAYAAVTDDWHRNGGRFR